jgi:hypothetical protein
MTYPGQLSNLILGTILNTLLHRRQGICTYVRSQNYIITKIIRLQTLLHIKKITYNA